MENKRLIIPKNASFVSVVICGRKGKISYLSKLTADREICLSVKSGRKALYIGNVSVTADASVCRIGLESLPYPKQRCIHVSPRLSAKIRKLKNAEVRL